MKAVVTRVSSASVTVEGAVIGAIEQGFLVLLGVGPEDGVQQVTRLVDKICGMRIFSDEAGKMNLDLAAIGGSLLVVSQFTLYADTKSRRPGFTKAAPPQLANTLYEEFLTQCRARGFSVSCGEFGSHMEVASVNDGPVTILLDTDTF